VHVVEHVVDHRAHERLLGLEVVQEDGHQLLGVGQELSAETLGQCADGLRTVPKLRVSGGLELAPKRKADMVP
jgi:hypothetical protein